MAKPSLLQRLGVRVECRLDVVRWNNQPRSRYGYLVDDDEYRSWQELRLVWSINGVDYWHRVVDTEDIPQWAVIAQACLGYSGWVSRFADVLRMSRQQRVVAAREYRVHGRVASPQHK